MLALNKTKLFLQITQFYIELPVLSQAFNCHIMLHVPLNYNCSNVASYAWVWIRASAIVAMWPLRARGNRTMLRFGPASERRSPQDGKRPEMWPGVGKPSRMDQLSGGHVECSIFYGHAFLLAY